MIATPYPALLQGHSHMAVVILQYEDKRLWCDPPRHLHPTDFPDWLIRADLSGLDWKYLWECN